MGMIAMNIGTKVIGTKTTVTEVIIAKVMKATEAAIAATGAETKS